MVLIAITMTFAVPGLSSFVFNDPLKKTTRKLTLLITRASQQALNTSLPYTLKYDIGSRSFTAQAVVGSDGEEDVGSWQKLSLPDSVELRDIAFSTKGVLASSRATIYCNEKGYLEPCLIHLQNQGGDVMTLKLSPFAGKVTVYKQDLALTADTFR